MVSTTKTNKPFNPRGNDQSPKGYNRAALYSGKALDFDGVNDKLTTPNISVQSSNVWTYSFYWNLQDASQTGYIFDARTSSVGYTLYYYSNDNNLDLFQSTGGGNRSVQTFEADQWYHIALSSNGTNVGLYVNGQFVENIAGAIQTYSSTGDLYISSSHVSSVYAEHILSNFKAFDVALTAAQVADLYNNPEKVVPTGVDNTALKLWLPMQEGAGTTAYDGSGNGNHGTISGATYVNGVGAPVAQTAVIDWNKGSNLVAYSEEFDQWTANTSSVTANDTTAPDGQTTADKWIPNSGTTSANLRFNSADIATGTDYVFFAFAKAAGFDVIELDFQDSRFSDVNASFNLTSGTITATGGDNVTEGIIDKGNGWYLCYIVGNSIGSGSNFCIFRQNNSTGDGSKGYYLWGAGFAQASDIVPYVKTSNVIQGSDVLLPQGLTSGRDITGVNLFENVRKQGALNLDGNSWAEVHDNASLDLSDANASFEAWVYHIDTGSASQYIMNKFDGTTGVRVRTETGNNFGFYASDGTNNIADSGTFSLTANAWNHIVLTTDGTNFKRYINGALVDTDVAGTPLTTFANADSLYIGSEQTTTSLAQSRIAQPRIYNRALTAEEVQRNYNAGKNIYTN